MTTFFSITSLFGALIISLIHCAIFFLLYVQVKSRMMGDSSYKSTLDCFIKTLKNDVWLFSTITIFLSDMFSLILNSKLCEYNYSGFLIKCITTFWYQILSGS